MSRAKRTRGISANSRVENRLVHIFAGQGIRAHEWLWESLSPSLRAMLPEGATLDSMSMQDAYTEAFDRFTDLGSIKERATRLYRTDSRESLNKYHDLLRRTVGATFNDLSTTEADDREIKRSIDATVERIVTINREHFDNFKRTIEASVLEGRPFAVLRDQVLGATAEFAYPKWMVDRVVIDQFLTAHSKIQENRQRASGVTHYFWRDASDARVRKTHAANDGMRFAWDDPPDTGHPGEEILCRCIADPDLRSIKASIL